MAAHREETAARLTQTGADLVLMPYRDASFAAARMITGDARAPDYTATDPDGQKALLT